MKRGEPADCAHLVKSGCVKLVDVVEGKRVPDASNCASCSAGFCQVEVAVLGPDSILDDTTQLNEGSPVNAYEVVTSSQQAEVYSVARPLLMGIMNRPAYNRLVAARAEIRSQLLDTVNHTKETVKEIFEDNFL